MKISIKTVEALRPTDKDTVHWDDALTGFGVRVRPSGRKTFVVYFRDAFNVQQKMTLGAYPALMPDAARTAAKVALGRVALGENPATEKQTMRHALTVAELGAEYFEKARLGLILGRGGKKKKLSTLDTDEGRFLRHVVPLLGRKPVRTVTARDIRSFIEDVTLGKTAGAFKTGPRGLARVTGGEGAARRAAAMLSGIFTYAEAEGYCDRHPFKGVRLTADGKRKVRISDEQYRALGAAIDNAEPWQLREIARLIAITGLRRTEASGLRWEEVDFGDQCFRFRDGVDGRTIKSGLVRPMGLTAARMLQALRERSADSPFVFPSERTRGRTAFTVRSKAWNAMVGELKLTPHMLRHGFGTLIFNNERSELMVSYVLGHSTSRTTTQGYIHAPEQIILNACNRAAEHVLRAIKTIYGRDIV